MGQGSEVLGCEAGVTTSKDSDVEVPAESRRRRPHYKEPLFHQNLIGLPAQPRIAAGKLRASGAARPCRPR